MQFLSYVTYLIDLIAAGLIGVFFPYLFGKNRLPLGLNIATGAALIYFVKARPNLRKELFVSRISQVGIQRWEY
ncbi:MAG TPA: hypothetical protein VNY07_13810 [Chthoniobacterales bacterium]|jgi:hypothetical protein|nr:hypothetical protein [Chthoniobacterales bacterium]